MHYTRIEWGFYHSFLLALNIRQNIPIQWKSIWEQAREKVRQRKKRLEINCKHNDKSFCLSKSRKFAVQKKRTAWGEGGGKTFDLQWISKWFFYLSCQMKISFKFIHFNLMSFFCLFSTSIALASVRDKNFYQLFGSIEWIYETIHFH